MKNPQLLQFKLTYRHRSWCQFPSEFTSYISSVQDNHSSIFSIRIIPPIPRIRSKDFAPMYEPSWMTDELHINQVKFKGQTNKQFKKYNVVLCFDIIYHWLGNCLTSTYGRITYNTNTFYFTTLCNSYVGLYNKDFNCSQNVMFTTCLVFSSNQCIIIKYMSHS